MQQGALRRSLHFFARAIGCIDRGDQPYHVRGMAKREKNDIELIKTWTLSAAVTMGSSARARGLLQEIQARLPARYKKVISLEGVDLILAMPADEKPAFNAAVSVVSKAVQEAPSLPVIPREIQDILGMKPTERHRWLADGRLPSAGTRTVRLAGRARQITFHVFDPKIVEDLLDRGVIDEWRIEDAEAKAAKRAKAAYQRQATRVAIKKKQTEKAAEATEDPASSLQGWEDFDLDGLLR